MSRSIPGFFYSKSSLKIFTGLLQNTSFTLDYSFNKKDASITCASSQSGRQPTKGIREGIYSGIKTSNPLPVSLSTVHHPLATSSGSTSARRATKIKKNDSDMTSKVLVKLPTVPFSQGKKSAELMTLSTRNEGVTTPVRSQQGINGERTAQLEQNIKFLQEQHQATLFALHQEIESLRQRNRDLQFQLVFNKGTISITSSPSSPEDNSNGFVKPKGSPVCVNVTPLQIELLERDLEELKVSYNEAKKQNFQLQETIEKQKIKLEQTEKEKEKLPSTEAGIQVGETSEVVQNDLIVRLEDAEALVKRLQRENADQQREIASIKASSAKNGNRNGHGRGRGNENGHYSRGSSGDPGQSNRHSYKFPPLENENYWRNVTRGRSSYERQSGSHRRNHQEKEDSEPAEMPCRIVLPELLNSNVKSDFPCSPTIYRSQRGYHNNGIYYRVDGNRKFRGQGRPRDRRDQDHRGDYRDRNSREQ